LIENNSYLEYSASLYIEIYQKNNEFKELTESA